MSAKVVFNERVILALVQDPHINGLLGRKNEQLFHIAGVLMDLDYAISVRGIDKHMPKMGLASKDSKIFKRFEAIIIAEKAAEAARAESRKGSQGNWDNIDRLFLAEDLAGWRG